MHPTEFQNLQNMVLQAPIGICLLDAKTMVTELLNDKFLEVAGKPREAIIGKFYWEPFAEVRELYEDALKNVALTGEAYHANEVEMVLIRHGSEEQVVVTFVYNPIKDDSGKVVKIAVWVVENTLQARARNEIGALNDRLTGANREMQTANTDLSLLNSELLLSNKNIHLLNLRLQESETDFKRLVEQAPVAILVFRGPDMVIDLVNLAMLEILGHDASIIGKPLLEGLPEIKGAPAVDQLFHVFQTGEASDGNEEPVPIMTNGVIETRYFNFSYRPLLEKGKIIGVMDVAVEVTAQVLARKNLEANEQRLQSILDTMAEGVVIVNASGQPTYANTMAQQIMGISEEQFHDRTYNDTKWHNERIDGTPLPREEHPMYVVMRTGLAVFDQEIGIVWPDGEKIFISVNAAPLTGLEGQINGGIISFTDVTARRKLLQQKEDFISVASHELRTPVTSLKAALQLLDRMQGNITPEVLAKLLAQANRSLNKLSDLITSLLNSNRISQGRFLVNKTTFPISALLQDCCQHILSAGSHEIIRQGDLEMQITADEQQIDQVLVNLLNNAVKYAPQSRRIIINVERQIKAVKITVTDQGPGIPADQTSHIFERYYQADRSGGELSGLGLGLYICAEIIEKHGGEIGVESTVGQGSSFWFTLPL
ncbi:PAS domain-containing protein [Mucilaginibacter sp. SMC90]|uniref:PAS domain-containing sensor histidine kinase n=1 Tax=Mucilaginibacter sp. SMC90 TaxID=2929803 RepID=UPI001FB272D3|nr:PAS domain-containing protein [Mucilaginibacter sp. SMC90]UOE50939.1 PAS domain-containing protein [Mucilaginibacter sp. SMC90]